MWMTLVDKELTDAQGTGISKLIWVDSVLQIFGFGAVLTEVVLSGFASIYFEKVVKSTTEVVSIWERNFQLGIYSILIYGSIIVYENLNGSPDAPNPVKFGANWTMMTLLVSVLGANILKLSKEELELQLLESRIREATSANKPSFVSEVSLEKLPDGANPTLAPLISSNLGLGLPLAPTNVDSEMA
eukprot:gene18668-18967_t